jgi:hypothetical protein
VRWAGIARQKVKRIVMLGGASLVSGVAVKFSYAAREALAVLAALGVVFSVVLLILALGFLVFRATAWMYSWLRTQSQQWNRVSGEWVYVLIQPQPAIAKPVPRIP